MASSQTGSSASYLCWTLDVGRSALATPKLSAYAGSTFFFRHGRVAESGLRHSTRNRAWGNPPWVRIPPLPPVFAFAYAQQREFYARRCAAKGRRFPRRQIDVDSRSAFAILSAASARNVAL